MITTDLPQYDDTVEITLETVIQKEDQILEEIAVESESTRQFVKAETDGINLNMKEINSTLGTDDVIPLDKLIIKMARPFSDRVIITSNTTWIVPKNVNQIRVSGCASGSGQKAGAYKYEELINVVEGQEIPITVGSGNTVFGTFFSLVAGSLSEAFPNLKLGYETGLNGGVGGKPGASDVNPGGEGGLGGFGGAFGFGGGGGAGASWFNRSASGGAGGGDASKGALIYTGGTKGSGGYASGGTGRDGSDGMQGSLFGGGNGGISGRSYDGYSGAGGGGAAGGYGAGAGQGGKGISGHGGAAQSGQASPGVIIIEY